mmetsp:Transcript_24192/g.61900  ORF Transcript_24192/g.61900 Transcript_24192/m.61900 type:complete len:297 (-) Transcript_24192:822-1712(-)
MTACRMRAERHAAERERHVVDWHAARGVNRRPNAAGKQILHNLLTARMPRRRLACGRLREAHLNQPSNHLITVGLFKLALRERTRRRASRTRRRRGRRAHSKVLLRRWPRGPLGPAARGRRCSRCGCGGSVGGRYLSNVTPPVLLWSVRVANQPTRHADANDETITSVCTGSVLRVRRCLVAAVRRRSGRGGRGAMQGSGALGGRWRLRKLKLLHVAEAAAELDRGKTCTGGSEEGRHHCHTDRTLEYRRRCDDGGANGGADAAQRANASDARADGAQTGKHGWCGQPRGGTDHDT